MSAMSQIPSWLTITKVGDQHYQLTDNSVESIGLCLGVFHSRDAAERLAEKIARARGFSPNVLPPRTNKWGSTLSARLAADWRNTLSVRGLVPHHGAAPQEESI